MISSGQNIRGAKIGILGLTFKENCPDLRNSKVVDIINELQSYGVEVLVHDPIADPAEAMQHYGVELVELERMRELGAVVIAVSHQEYKTMDAKSFGDMVCEGGNVVDVKGMLNGLDVVGNGGKIWRL